MDLSHWLQMYTLLKNCVTWFFFSVKLWTFLNNAKWRLSTRGREIWFIFEVLRLYGQYFFKQNCIVLQEADFHFQIEWGQSRSKNSELFDATLKLKNLIGNGSSIIRKRKNQKSTGFGKENNIGVREIKKKLARATFLSVRWSQSKEEQEKRCN